MAVDGLDRVAEDRFVSRLPFLSLVALPVALLAGILWLSCRPATESSVGPSAGLPEDLPAWIEAVDDEGLRHLLTERAATARRTGVADDALSLGHGFEANEIFEPAAAVYAVVTRQAPEDPRGWYHHGAVLASLGDFEGARAAFETARARIADERPEAAVVDWRLGAAQARLGNLAAARQAFDRAVESAPDEPAYRIARARLDLRDDRLAEAESALRPLALAGDAVARRLLGETLRLQGRLEEARPLLETAAGREAPRRDPWMEAIASSAVGFGAALERTQGLLELRRWSEALPLLESLHRQKPDDSTVRLNLATARLGVGDSSGAIGLLEGLLAEGDDRSVVHRNLAVAYFTVGRLPDAWRHAGEAIERGGQGARPYEIRAAILQRRGQFGASLVALAKARELAPRDPAILRRMAHAQEQVGLLQEALATLEALEVLEAAAFAEEPAFVGTAESSGKAESSGTAAAAVARQRIRRQLEEQPPG